MTSTEIKIGEVIEEVANLKYQLAVNQFVIEQIISANPNIITPSNKDLDDFRKRELEYLQKKYPKWGITKG